MKLAGKTIVTALFVSLPAAAMAQTSSPQGVQPGARVGQPAVQIEVNSLIGSTVRSLDGKDLGKVHKLMLDPGDGRITTIVISMGGIFGIGGQELSVPWNAVLVGRDPDAQKLVVTVQQAVLDSAPNASDAQQGAGSASPGTSPSAQPGTSPPSR